MRDHRVGQQVGEYTLVAPLEAGEHGHRYRAEHVRSGNAVTITLLAQRAWHAVDGPRAIAAGRALAAVRHPNVAEIYDVGVVDETVYIVSQFVEGTSLAERWSTRASVKEVVSRSREILRGLAAIHAQGLVHRGLRPSNVIVVEGMEPDAGASASFTRAERIVLVDVGLATLVPRRDPDAQEVSVAEPRTLTPRYLAPELLRDAPTTATTGIDGRADLFALGVMMYEALAGTPPFAGDDVQVVQAILKGAVPALPRDVPAELRAIVMRALDNDPAQRFASADEMRAALSSKRPLPGDAAQARSANRSRIVWPLVAGGLVLVAAGATAIATCGSSSRQPQQQPLETLQARAQAGAGSGTGSGAGSGSATRGIPAPHVTVPPPLPGEPALKPEQERMLQKFAANISQGVYIQSELEFLLCTSETGKAQLVHSNDPVVAALMRRMVALFRSAPGMAHVTCTRPRPP